MEVLKLSLSDFDAIDYDLIAIHTSLEDYRLAYFLNQKLPILLSKSSDFLEFKTSNGSAFFSKFSYHEDATDEEWTLIENKDELVEGIINTPTDLFSQEKEKIIYNVYFLPEMKKVNYFLKVESTVLRLTEIISYLNTIKQISTAYAVDVKNLKSKNNLIF
ncbi:IPExxxVDY family protein [Flavobacterium sp. SM2513]|uniref:IPExxxVDY family protein n=1 Tax=Flavobacterium sp. SM2513 TaxID=3424766 RepID=UPI003D7F29C9